MQKFSRLLLLFIFLLIPVSLANTQSSAEYRVVQSTITSGGVSGSPSYTAVSVIGQPATDVVNSASYQVSGGFLRSQSAAIKIDYDLWLPIITADE